MFSILGCYSWNSSNTPRLSCDGQKCMLLIFNTMVEIHFVAFWYPFTLTCQALSLLRAITFALGLLSRMFHITSYVSFSVTFSKSILQPPFWAFMMIWNCFLFFASFSSISPALIEWNLHEERISYFTFTIVHWHTVECLVYSRFFCIFELYELKHIECWALWIKGADDHFPRSNIRFLHHIEKKFMCWNLIFSVQCDGIRR